MPRRRFDVVLLSDFRFPGGTSSSLATEIRVQAAAGYRTALLHVPAPVLSTPRPFNAKIRACLDEGLAELVLADDPLEADLLVVRHPDVLSRPPRVRPNVRAGRKVLVVNQVPRDSSQPTPFYSVGEVDQVARDTFGSGWTWAPIGPLVRDALLAEGVEVPLSERDWHNVLRTDEWRTSRAGFVGDRPVIGRHSRAHWRKWPEDKHDVLAAYPDDPRYVVRILGGAETPATLLGRVPANWEVLPFDSVPVGTFLSGIDFFVYYHHSGLVEAFGRAVIEAIAAGAVAVLPPHFERLFGEACCYGQPADVRGIVDEFYADPAAYRAQSAKATAYVERHFSHAAHARRVAELIGERDVAAPTAPSRRRVLALLGERATLEDVAHVRALAGDAQLLMLVPGAAGAARRRDHAEVQVLPGAGDVTGDWAAAYFARAALVLCHFTPDRVLVHLTSGAPEPPIGWSAASGATVEGL